MLKKGRLVFVLLFGIMLGSSTTLFASNAADTVLFPVKYLFNGDEKQLPDDYATLNYNGHVYVPVRFMAETMGAYVGYDDSSQTVTINYDASSGLFLRDEKEPRARAGNLQLTKDGDKTIIKGQMAVDEITGDTKVFGPRLIFLDNHGNELNTVFIVPREDYILVEPGVITNFEVIAEGDLTGIVKFKIDWLNRQPIERPIIMPPK